VAVNVGKQRAIMSDMSVGLSFGESQLFFEIQHLEKV
jgi:hypothetical protein